MLADSSFLCCTSFQPVCVRCRFGSCELTSAYAHIFRSARLSHIQLLSRTIPCTLTSTHCLRSSHRKRRTCAGCSLSSCCTTYSYHTASTILAGSGAVHSTQCSAHPWHKAWERSVTTPDAAITVHKQRLGPTDAPCGDHKTGSKAAVRHATRRPGLQILSHNTPFATGSQT